MLEVQTVFKRHYGYTPPHLLQAPRGLVLLGDRAEETGGLALTVAVHPQVLTAFSLRSDGKIQLVSGALPAPVAFSITRLEPDGAHAWIDAIKLLLLELRKRGVHFGGFNAAMGGASSTRPDSFDLPALAIVTALTLRQMFPYTLTETGITAPPKPDAKGELPAPTHREKLEIVRLCVRAAPAFHGRRMLESLPALFGKAFHAIEVDCQSLSVESVPFFGECALITFDTAMEPAPPLVDSDGWRDKFAAASRALGVKSLRTVDAQFLSANKARLSESHYRCAYHAVGEVQRVIHGTRALQEGDLAQFGQFLLQSYESERDVLQNTSPELNLLADLARIHPACLGARPIRNGTATINLVARAQADTFVQSIRSGYEQRMGSPPDATVLQVTDGAGPVRAG